MATVANVQIGVPGGAAGKSARDAVIAFYCGLLGMNAYEPFGNGYIKLTRGDGCWPELALEGDGGVGDVRPQWPDPDHPQQVHLDVEVADLDRVDEAVVATGATRLQGGDVFRVFVDPVGHPFCLYASDVALPRLVRIVFDCPSPRALASFYEQVLGMHRVLDTSERVEIAGHDPDTVHLAFQYALGAPPRWMDPRHPAQLHLDLNYEDVDAERSLLGQLGAIRLKDMPMHTVWADPAGHPFCG